MNLNFKKPLHQVKRLFETSNLEGNTDDDFKSGSYDDHLSCLDDLNIYGSQEFDSYEEPHAYSRKIPRFSLVKALYK